MEEYSGLAIKLTCATWWHAFDDDFFFVKYLLHDYINVFNVLLGVLHILL